MSFGLREHHRVGDVARRQKKGGKEPCQKRPRNAEEKKNEQMFQLKEASPELQTR